MNNKVCKSVEVNNIILYLFFKTIKASYNYEFLQFIQKKVN